MRRWLALVLILMLSVPMTLVNAGGITVTVSGDRAVIEATLSIDMANIPIATCNWYKNFIARCWMDNIARADVKGQVSEVIEKHLREDLKLEKAKVESIEIEFSMGIVDKSVTATPDANKTVTGSWVSGNLTALTAVDGSVIRFDSYNDTNTMRLIVEFNITIPENVPLDKVLNFTLTVAGNLSKTVNTIASVELYNFENMSFDIMNETIFNTTSPIEATITVTSPSSYISAGKIWIRMNVTDVQTHPSTTVTMDIDMIELEIFYQVFSITSYFKLVVSGISTTGIEGRYINAKFRYINPDRTISYGGFIFSPARTFLINLHGFNVPLEKWTRTFNGTHTIFTMTVDYTITIENGITITVDPTETLVVEGEATAEGDTIFVKERTTEFWITIVATAVTVAVVAYLAYVKIAKKALPTRPRKYLRV
ncbi:hypothetical protein DRJ16_06095 [Candidatus Woesearchaeota archaeon]|nr:MAG: hypothetical protein DRJ16_06095 [Candidatus Woesearchaeota archaeon]